MKTTQFLSGAQVDVYSSAEACEFEGLLNIPKILHNNLTILICCELPGLELTAELGKRGIGKRFAYFHILIMGFMAGDK